MNIRPLRATEIETVVEELWRPFAEDMADRNERFELADDADAAITANISQGIKQENVYAFVAENGDELAGYIILEIRSAPPIFSRGKDAAIDQIYVKPTYRRKGVGKALIDQARVIAREREAEDLVLILDADNQAALEFYDDLGFELWRHRLIQPL